jgi:hypothetical protein
MTYKTELPATVVKAVIKLSTDNDDDLLGQIRKSPLH